MRTKQAIHAEMADILDRADRERRNLTLAEDQEYTRLTREFDGAPDERDLRPAGEPIRNLRLLPGYEGPAGAGASPVLTREQRLADRVARAERPLSLAKYLKGTLLGDWDRDAQEERTMAVGTGSAGGFLVPTPLSAEVIDLARNQMRVIQAGALTVPMEHSTLKIAKITGDPGVSWKQENNTLAPSDVTLDVVTFTAQTLPVMVKFSRELFEDAQNADETIRTCVAKALALELDRVALYGTGTAPEPKGLINQAGLATVSMGTNGGALTNFDPFVDAMLAVEDANETPGAAIFAPRTGAALAKLKDSQNRYLEPPAKVKQLQFLPTNQVPTNRTQGTATNASDIFVGEWSELLIGMRTEIQMQLLQERYADSLQLATLAWLRADIQVAHIGGFAAIVGVTP